ncbi:MAG: Rieske 2Fe-2S domain-containing protein [Gammaproteobacteria bacterium]|nr:Rieske 2Fe-2S domain-containing protein [Gammaproteobacteria bacterium]
MSEGQLIAASSGLEEGGKGLRFTVKDHTGEELPAFVIHYDYQYFAYLNRCGHIAVQLDYMPGEFFSDDGRTLICSTHGAEYAPDSGACLGGPCYGIGLEPLTVSHTEGRLYLHDDDYEVVEDNV